VIVDSAGNPAARTRRTGVILDFRGSELIMRTRLGGEETISAARIVELQTTWTAPHLEARQARSEGRFDEAIAAFREAMSVEMRPWARRQVMAEASGSALDAGRIDDAVSAFLAILAGDPDTRHFNTIPVAWRAPPADPALEQRAAAWLAIRDAPAASLIGASWLLSTSRRGEAIATLEALQKSSDPRIAGLATSQLWRTRLVTASLDDARRWKNQLESVPLEVQATGWYVLGELFVRHDQPQQASLAYLKVPLVFREQRSIAADALLAAGKQLEKMSQPQEAAGLYRELVRDFPQLPAAIEAQTRLTAVIGAGP
jgi:tetratricopeptide (TPR) repeat protein